MSDKLDTIVTFENLEDLMLVYAHVVDLHQCHLNKSTFQMYLMSKTAKDCVKTFCDVLNIKYKLEFH